jgi:hypothetical protein
LRRQCGERYVASFFGKGRAIDIGTGAGGFLDALSRNGWDAEGLEPDIAHANAEAVERHYGVTVHKMPLEDFRAERKYNLATAFNVIERVLRPREFLGQLGALLSDCGILYIDMPGLDRPHTDIDSFFWKPHVNTFSRDSLRTLLELCGFKAIDIWYSELRFLAAIAQKGDARRGIGAVPNFSAARLKDAVAAAPSPLNPNSDTLFLAPKSKPPALRLVHVGIHRNTNAGDTLLFPAVRCLLQKELALIEFSLLGVHEPVTSDTIDFINSHDGLIIGGGGLFLKDTNPNSISGWQWACPRELMERIRVPVAVFAVGYNRFRGQEDFDGAFSESMNALAAKSDFFSLRNSGSVEALKSYIDPKLHGRLRFQPCPTALLSKFYPCAGNAGCANGADRAYGADGADDACGGATGGEGRGEGRLLAVNIPFDRYALRYKYQEPRLFGKIAEAVTALQGEGWRVVLYSHNTRHDGEAARWFEKFGLSLEPASLGGIPPEKIIERYRQAAAVLAGRGHAQMIPFGLNTPVFSLISHDKLGFFLNDIGHSEWGAEILSDDLPQKIMGFARASQSDGMRRSLVEAQNALWNLTMENMKALKSVFGI